MQFLTRIHSDIIPNFYPIIMHYSSYSYEVIGHFSIIINPFYSTKRTLTVNAPFAQCFVVIIDNDLLSPSFFLVFCRSNEYNKNHVPLSTTTDIVFVINELSSQVIYFGLLWHRLATSCLMLHQEKQIKRVCK